MESKKNSEKVTWMSDEMFHPLKTQHPDEPNELCGNFHRTLEDAQSCTGCKSIWLLGIFQRSHQKNLVQ